MNKNNYYYSSVCSFVFISLLPRSTIPATGSRGILQGRCGKVTGSCRKTPEVAETWKQYSARKLSGGFLSTSCAFRQDPAGNHRTKSENFPAGYCLRIMMIKQVNNFIVSFLKLFCCYCSVLKRDRGL